MEDTTEQLRAKSLAQGVNNGNLVVLMTIMTVSISFYKTCINTDEMNAK